MNIEWCAADLVEGMGRGRFLAGTGHCHLLGVDRRAVAPGAAEVAEGGVQ